MTGRLGGRAAREPPAPVVECQAASVGARLGGWLGGRLGWVGMVAPPPQPWLFNSVGSGDGFGCLCLDN